MTLKYPSGIRSILSKALVATAICAASIGASAQTTSGIPAHGKLVKLFNGKNLDGFDILLKSSGVNHDEKHVFTVEKGVIHVSGDDFGGIVTKSEHENYYLRAEFKWGEKTYQDKFGKARDCGILYHIDEPLTEVPKDVWPRAFEFQIQEGGTGDIWLVKGATLKVKGAPVISEDKDGPNRYVKSQRFGGGPWKDVTGFRDPNGEVEKPHGEWNLLELVADHDHVKYYVNGKLVNEGTDLNATKGRILFQTEGAETYYRNLEIAPLK
jgi:Domain of Unknown Function (DUF1080)